MDAHADSRANVEISMVVTRADGTVQDMGLVSAHYTWRKPFKRITWPIRRMAANRRIKKANRGR